MSEKRLRNTVTGEVCYSENPYTAIYPDILRIFNCYKNVDSYTIYTNANGGPTYECRINCFIQNKASLQAKLSSLTSSTNTDATLTLYEKIVKNEWDQLLEEANDTTNNYFRNFGVTSGNWVLEEV